MLKIYKGKEHQVYILFTYKQKVTFFIAESWESLPKQALFTEAETVVNLITHYLT